MNDGLLVLTRPALYSSRSALFQDMDSIRAHGTGIIVCGEQCCLERKYFIICKLYYILI